MKDIIKLGLTLFSICVVAALVLAFTNNVTSPVIAQRNIQANNESRKIVLPEADEFKQLKEINSDMVLEFYEGIKNGKVIGYTIKTLEDLTEIQKNISAEEYNQKLKSVKELSIKLKNGEFLKSVLKQYEKEKK